MLILPFQILLADTWLIKQSNTSLPPVFPSRNDKKRKSRCKFISQVLSTQSSFYFFFLRFFFRFFSHNSDLRRRESLRKKSCFWIVIPRDFIASSRSTCSVRIIRQRKHMVENCWKWKILPTVPRSVFFFSLPIDQTVSRWVSLVVCRWNTARPTFSCSYKPEDRTHACIRVRRAQIEGTGGGMVPVVKL